MQDNFQREINYLRVSVTDRCNLRCFYCLPPHGVKSIPHEEILRLEEIVHLVRAATLVGVKKVRITGGEPLVRKGLVSFVEALAAIPAIDDLALTTNGILLAEYAAELKAAGLKRVNVSLDSLRPEKYAQITRGGELARAWAGIEAALALEMHPVKLNTVLLKGLNDDEIVDLAGLSRQLPLHVRFIELMPVGACKEWAADYFVPAGQAKEIIEQNLGRLHEVRKLAGSGPAHYYRLAGAPGTIGFIPAVSDHFCNRCNRLRLTSTGALRSCLYDEGELNAKGLLRSGASLEELAGLVARAIAGKPGRHRLGEAGGSGGQKVMSRIGG
ncbi:MAG: GTP 3',8-cyclase MoaA [Bacillota bacterium]